MWQLLVALYYSTCITALCLLYMYIQLLGCHNCNKRFKNKSYGRQDLIEVFKMYMYKGFTRLSIDELFERDVNIKGTRGHTLRLKKKQSVRDVRRYFFSQRVVNRWNSLDQKTVDVGSINSFKGRLDKIRKTRMGFLWILYGPQSPRPHGDRTPVRPHKVSYKVS